MTAEALPHHHHMLSRTRRGEVCWVALNNWNIDVFVLDGVRWKRKWHWPVPVHFYTCRMIGFAEGSQQVMLECLGEICCINVEDGASTFLNATIAVDNCLSFETDHLLLDHD
jgi:hypothetical protein